MNGCFDILLFNSQKPRVVKMCFISLLSTLQKQVGNSLAIQWLGLYFHSSGCGSIPGEGAKTPHATQHSQKTKKKKRNGQETELHSTVIFTLGFIYQKNYTSEETL